MLKQSRIIGAALTAVAALTLIHTAGAATTFFGEDINANPSVRLNSYPNSSAAASNYISNLTGVGTETFESYAAGTGPVFSSTFAGAGTAAFSGSETVGVVTGGGLGTSGEYPISGTHFVYNNAQPFTINFTAPIAAFGFYGTDVGDVSGRITLTLSGPSGTTVLTVPSTFNNGTGVLYFGYIDTAHPFTSVVIGDTAAGNDYFGFDDMTIGSIAQVTGPAGTVPDTGATLLLLGGAVLSLGLLRKFAGSAIGAAI